MAKYLVWAIKPKNTSVAIKLANGMVVYSSGVAIGMVLNGVWQTYATFLVLDVPFEVILGMLWLPCVCP